MKKIIFSSLISYCFVFSLSQSCVAHGQFEDRLHQLDHDIAHSPNDASLFVKRGRIYRDAEQWMKALAEYNRALELNADYAEALYWKADAYYFLSHYSQAIHYLTLFIRQKPNAPGAHFLLAKSYGHLGNSGQAIKHFNMAIEYNRIAPPQWYIDRARFLSATDPLNMQNIEAGIQDGIRRHGELINFTQLMYNLYLSQENFARALFWLDKLPAVLLDSPKWLNARAQLLVALNQSEQAFMIYQQVIDNIDNLPERKQRVEAIRQEKENAQLGIKKLNK